MGRLIFLDFDGVLRRDTSDTSCFESDCLEKFESAVRQCPISKIVISSTWRLAIPLTELRGKFSPDVAARIIGKTPEIMNQESYERHAEIMAYLNERKLTAIPWVAIDDNPELFPKGSPVIITNPKCGFDADCADQLVSMLLTAP